MKFFSLIFLFFYTLQGLAEDCHPKINSSLPQYIVGYGSLIDETSKKRTDSTADENIPVLIKGFKRSWSAHGDLPGINTTFLNISANLNSSFNGIIYRLDPENILLYDEREKGYCRKILAEKEILSLSTLKLPSEKQIWIYIQPTKDEPTENFPIVQSYVDIFIRGCIQIEQNYKLKDYAKNCIKTTDNWSNYWINDRIFPRRPLSYEPYAIQIDSLLKELLPENFKHISFEKTTRMNIE